MNFNLDNNQFVSSVKDIEFLVKHRVMISVDCLKYMAFWDIESDQLLNFKLKLYFDTVNIYISLDVKYDE